ncbi:Uncharacterised protein [Candidatus Anstonella stagnisolia]|nr:Uncharacterised protein [Candidatus Anstonella stagnisolia]
MKKEGKQVAKQPANQPSNYDLQRQISGVHEDIQEMKRQLLPLAPIIAAHEERIKTVEKMEARIWGVFILALGGLAAAVWNFLRGG